MSTPFTPANVDALKRNPAWEHVVKCVKSELENAEVTLEMEGEFAHGKGIGMRKVCWMLLALPDQMAEQADGGTMVKSIRKMVGR